MDILGERLKKLRDGKKLLQKQVSNELNITVQRYSSYENNLRNPEIKILIALAKYFNVSTDYLLGIDNQTYIDKCEITTQIKELKDIINKLEKYIENSK